MFTIFGAVAQLERDLIRKLRSSGMTFRDIAKYYTGTVASEVRAMKKEGKQTDFQNKFLQPKKN